MSVIHIGIKEDKMPKKKLSISRILQVHEKQFLKSAHLLLIRISQLLTHCTNSIVAYNVFFSLFGGGGGVGG